MPNCRYLPWRVFRRSEVAGFDRSLTPQWVGSASAKHPLRSQLRRDSLRDALD